MFLGVSAELTKWTHEEKECCLVMNENPLADFVVLPSRLAKGHFFYSNLICGVIRGAL